MSHVFARNATRPLLLILISCLFATLVSAGPSKLIDTDLLVDVGQSVSDVKTAYGVATDPDPGPPLGSNTRVLRLPSEGITFEFNLDRLVTIAVEHPFARRVVGLHVGDAVDRVTALLGKPDDQFAPGKDL